MYASPVEAERTLVKRLRQRSGTFESRVLGLFCDIDTEASQYITKFNMREALRRYGVVMADSDLRVRHTPSAIGWTSESLRLETDTSPPCTTHTPSTGADAALYNAVEPDLNDGLSHSHAYTG